MMDWQRDEGFVKWANDKGLWNSDKAMFFQPWKARQPEIDALKVDADRYKWLRENLHRLQSMRPYHAPKPEELDAAIDAALKEMQ